MILCVHVGGNADHHHRIHYIYILYVYTYASGIQKERERERKERKRTCVMAVFRNKTHNHMKKTAYQMIDLSKYRIYRRLKVYNIL